MDRAVSLVWRARDWIADRADDLFHAPFWKVVAGAVIVTLALFTLSAAPNAGWDKLKRAALFGALALALAAFGLLRPFERGIPLG